MTASTVAFNETRPDAIPASHRHVAYWLLGVAALVGIMMGIGAATRLTGSGLSMVEWRPFTGFLPPMTQAEWERLFAAYQQYPEFQKVNFWMELPDFKEIFWLEFIHRVWGRVIGLAYFIPFVWFVCTGNLGTKLNLKLTGLLLLGGSQGLMGWIMVQSGMVDHPDVSQYKLAAHLMLAMVILAALVWVATDLLRGQPRGRRLDGAGWSSALLALILLTIASGAFVAGLDAGFAYNTFPLMEGDWLPDGLWVYEPTWRAMFEDHLTVQWDHRWLAKLTFAAVIAFWVMSRRWTQDPVARWAADLVLAAATLQVLLGIVTLLSVIWLPVATAHQLGGALLLSVTVVMVHVWRRRG